MSFSDNNTPHKPLPEEKFVQERRNPSYPFWIWFALAAMAVSLLWGVSNWYYSSLNQIVGSAPFLQVTNRQMSLFLWQFPEYMRINTSMKEGYLPGFQYQNGQVGPVLNQIDSYAAAPPEVLFLYHTWDRLLRTEIALRSFSMGELRDFLRYAPEWLPTNWPEAPASYRTLVAQLDNLPDSDLTKAVPALPTDVQIAITGWKNYFQEGQAIDQTAPTYQQLANFLQRYPHYTRSYWRNIVMDKRPQYLESYTQGSYQPEAVVPNDQLTAFLKVALYNDLQAQASH